MTRDRDDRLLDELYGEADLEDAALTPEDRRRLEAWDQVRARVREADDAEAPRPVFRAALREAVRAEAARPRGWARVRAWVLGPGGVVASAAAVTTALVLWVRPDAELPRAPDPVGPAASAASESGGSGEGTPPLAPAPPSAPKAKGAEEPREAERSPSAAPTPEASRAERSKDDAPRGQRARETALRGGELQAAKRRAVRRSLPAAASPEREEEAEVASKAEARQDRGPAAASGASRALDGAGEDFAAEAPAARLLEDRAGASAPQDAELGARSTGSANVRPAPEPSSDATDLTAFDAALPATVRRELEAARRFQVARDHEAATQALNRAAAKARSSPIARRVSLARAELALARGQPAEAADWARRALADGGTDPVQARAITILRASRGVTGATRGGSPRSGERAPDATTPLDSSAD